jgi:hypothetical protein
MTQVPSATQADEAQIENHQNTTKFRLALRQLKEKEICFDAGFDLRNVRVLLILGHQFTPMMVHTELASAFRFVLSFLASHEVRY